MQLPVVSDGPIFSLAREKIGEKRALGYVWCILRLNSGEHRCFGRRSTRKSPYGCLSTRRLIRDTRFDSSCRRIFAVNRRCRPSLLVCTFLRGSFLVLHALKAPLVKGSWRGAPEGLPAAAEKPSPMRGRWHGGAVTDEVGILRLRIAVHLISQPAADSFPS